MQFLLNAALILVYQKLQNAIRDELKGKKSDQKQTMVSTWRMTSPLVRSHQHSKGVAEGNLTDISTMRAAE